MSASVLFLAVTLVSGNWGGSNAFSLDADRSRVCIEAETSADALEFFLIPDGGAFEYYVFRVEANGGRSAKFLSEFGGIEPEPYGPIWTAKTKSAANGRWMARLEIPINAFEMTRARVWKETWKVNAAAYGKEGITTWTGGAKPVEKERKAFLGTFRAVSGFPKRAAHDDIHISSAMAIVSGVRGGNPVGRIKVRVVGSGSGAFTFETSCSEKTSVIVPFGGSELVADAVFSGGGRQMTRIRLVRSDGAVFERDYPLYVDYQPIRLKLTKPHYRGNFYPGQNADSVEGTVSSLVGEPIELMLEGPGFASRTLRLEKGGSFVFDTSGFADGDAVLSVRAGKETLKRKIRKLAPLPAGRHMAWIENGNLVVDGRPTARRNVYATGFMGGSAFDRKFAADNLHLTTNIVKVANLDLRYCDKKIFDFETKRDQEPSEKVWKWIDSQIAKAEHSPGVFYYIIDEPECFGMSAAYLRRIYEYVAEKDPYHVIACCSRAGETYIDIADWFETHPYLNPHVTAEGRREYLRAFNTLGGYVDAFKPDEHPDKCIGGTPTCFSYSDGDYPTFDEYVLNWWCEFVRGAKTMYPYAYHDLGDRPTLYEGTRYMFESMERLEDVILFGKRQTLRRDDRCECALWTMPAGDRTFALLNFTDKPQAVTVDGIKGRFREFRGTRRFDCTASLSVTLQPHESLIACEKMRDAGAKTFAQVRAEIDAAEYARTHRGNLLAGRSRDMEVVTSSGLRGAWGDDPIKLFDGTLDVIGWRDLRSWTRKRFFEMSFLKFVPTFRRIVLYGKGIDGFVVKVRKDGDWVEMKPAKIERKGASISYAFGQDVTTMKLRLEFPEHPVEELYEIEMFGTSREIGTAAPPPPPKGVHWTISTETFATNVGWYVSVPAKPSFLVFRLGDVPRLKEDGYTNWTMGLSGYGLLGILINGTKPGLYTLRLPTRRPGSEDPRLFIDNYNQRFDMGDLICCDLPANCAEFAEKNGQYRVRVKLAEPCEDVICSVYEERGNGPRQFILDDGLNVISMKPVDEKRTLWEGKGVPRTLADKKVRPFPFVRVNVLGGAMTEPIYTWLAK